MDRRFSADGQYLGWGSAGAFDPTDNNGLADIYTRAVAVPRIAFGDPDVGRAGTTATLTVTGGGFIAPVFASSGCAGSA